MSNKCSRCGRFAGLTEGIKCSKCSYLFHRDCAKLSPNGPVPAKWACCGCLKGVNKQSKPSAAKGLSTSSPTLSDTSNIISVTAEDATANISTEDHGPNSIVAELRLLRKEMASFRGEIAQLNVTLSGMNSRVDDIETRLARLEERPAICEIGDSGSIQAAISQLQYQLNDRDQELLMNNVQISGLQEVPGENLINLSCLIGKKLGLDITEQDVVSAERAGARRTPSVDTNDGMHGRQRPLVIRFVRRAVRDELLRAARVRRGADSSGILSTEPRRFYVNEHLTRRNKQLFYRAREEGRSKHFRFVWTKGGIIYMRQTDKAPVHRVRTEADLERLLEASSF